MKNMIVLMSVLCSSFLNSQIINIPDPNFKAKLLESSPSNSIAQNFNYMNIKIDANNDGEIQVSEALQVRTLALSTPQTNVIDSLIGISSFSNLQNLEFSNHNLTSVDLSQNIHLQYFGCYGNNLTSLDLSNNTDMISVNLANNNLTTLNLSGLHNLNFLECYQNQLTSLDLSDLDNLWMIWCNSNQITSLDVSNSTFLSSLYCQNNQLTILNLKNGTQENDLVFSNNPNLQSICRRIATYPSSKFSKSIWLFKLYC